MGSLWKSKLAEEAAGTLLGPRGWWPQAPPPRSELLRLNPAASSRAPDSHSLGRQLEEPSDF